MHGRDHEMTTKLASRTRIRRSMSVASTNPIASSMQRQSSCIEVWLIAHRRVELSSSRVVVEPSCRVTADPFAMAAGHDAPTRGAMDPPRAARATSSARVARLEPVTPALHLCGKYASRGNCRMRRSNGGLRGLGFVTPTIGDNSRQRFNVAIRDHVLVRCATRTRSPSP